MKLENYKNNEKYKQKVGIKNTKDLSYLDYIVANTVSFYFFFQYNPNMINLLYF